MQVVQQFIFLNKLLGCHTLRLTEVSIQYILYIYANETCVCVYIYIYIGWTLLSISMYESPAVYLKI